MVSMFQKKGILRRLLVSLFPEGGMMVICHRYDAGFQFLALGKGRICHHRMFGIGRDLCGSSSPTLLPKKGHLQQAAQGGCGLSFSGDIQDPPGQGPVQPALGDPASAGGLD